MVMFATLQLMQASTMANQRIPRMRGQPLNLFLGQRRRKSMGCTQESIETITSSITASGANVYLSASCSNVVIFLKIPLEVHIEHGFLGHHIYCSPKVNQGIRDHNAINVHIHYWATRIQTLQGDYPPKHLETAAQQH